MDTIANDDEYDVTVWNGNEWDAIKKKGEEGKNEFVEAYTT